MSVAATQVSAPGAWARFFAGDAWHSFRSSPMAMLAAAIAALCLAVALGADLIAPHNPFDLATLELADSMLPPAWMEGGRAKYLLGTDEQGRDVLSALMYGARISLFVGIASVLLSMAVGVSLGLIAGYLGGRVDAIVMRVCDVMLSFPSILIALLIAGVGRAMFPNAPESLAFGVLILAISQTGWVQYARTVRGSTMVERSKEYVQAARVIGVPRLRIMRKHVLPNVMGPVLVLSTIQVATAILTEATLSFLGIGVQRPIPSWGVLIADSFQHLQSFPYLALLPCGVLSVTILALNFVGEGVAEAMDPSTRGAY